MKGRTLGRYELVERLGRGGMGEVWRARDPALRRDVAVKVLRREGGEGGDKTLRDDFVRRFVREARAAASLKHPNVVAIHDVGVDEEPYIVMEWVEGAPLRGFIGDASVHAGGVGATIDSAFFTWLRAQANTARPASAKLTSATSATRARDRRTGPVVVGASGPRFATASEP